MEGPDVVEEVQHETGTITEAAESEAQNTGAQSPRTQSENIDTTHTVVEDVAVESVIPPTPPLDPALLDTLSEMSQYNHGCRKLLEHGGIWQDLFKIIDHTVLALIVIN